ncbi:hypothetical protein SAMN05660742_11863 [Propionispira arboris]|uniref:Uncharacterized protein n=1 Tax=Propionispira arboris TaxID=84035 RepID=A0A1H7C5A6_9FIRM|nr:hypothetical protein SAMN05660742_11863 [Propionispira arboris]
MKSLAKKITLLTLIAVIQVGFVAGITEASPFHADNSPAQVQFYDRGSGGPDGPPPPAGPDGPPPPPPIPPDGPDGPPPPPPHHHHHHHQWDN